MVDFALLCQFLGGVIPCGTGASMNCGTVRYVSLFFWGDVCGYLHSSAWLATSVVESEL